MLKWYQMENWFSKQWRVIDVTSIFTLFWMNLKGHCQFLQILKFPHNLSENYFKKQSTMISGFAFIYKNQNFYKGKQSFYVGCVDWCRHCGSQCEGFSETQRWDYQIAQLYHYWEMLREFYIILKTYLLVYVHCFSIHNG